MYGKNIHELAKAYPRYDPRLYRNLHSAYQRRKPMVRRLEDERPYLREASNPFLLRKAHVESLERLSVTDNLGAFARRRLHETLETEAFLRKATRDELYPLFHPFRLMVADLMGYLSEVSGGRVKLYTEQGASQVAPAIYEHPGLAEHRQTVAWRSECSPDHAPLPRDGPDSRIRVVSRATPLAEYDRADGRAIVAQHIVEQAERDDGRDIEEVVNDVLLLPTPAVPGKSKWFSFGSYADSLSEYLRDGA